MTEDRLEYHKCARIVLDFNLRHETDCTVYRVTEFTSCFETHHGIPAGNYVMLGSKGSSCIPCAQRFAYPDALYTLTIEHEGAEPVTVCSGTLEQLQEICKTLDAAYELWEGTGDYKGRLFERVESASFVATPVNGEFTLQYTDEWEPA